MLPPRSGSSGPSIFSSLWAWATTTPSAAAPPPRDDPPVVASGGISNALSESLSHVIVVQPLGAQRPGLSPLGHLEDAAGHRPDHVIDIRTPPPGQGDARPDRKHAVPPDHVIDIRQPAEDEDAPDELRAPARMARDGSQRLIPEMRIDVPPDAVPAVQRVAEREGAARPDQEVVTASATWRMATRMGMEQAACGFLTQLAGRTVGLVVTSALRRSNEAAALGGSLGAILASNLLFGRRTAVLITRALGLDDPTRAAGSRGQAGEDASEEARLTRSARVATALFVVPLLTQSLLPLLGVYGAGTAVGVKIAATIVGRLTAALVRDGLTQAVAGMLTSVEVVTASGGLPDPKLLRNEYDPLRIRLAVALYTMSSGLLLIGTADPVAAAIGQEHTMSFRDLVRQGLGTVLASSINEGLDGLLPSIARAGAANEHGLRLVPKGWHAGRERERAERNGQRPRPADSKRGNAQAPDRDGKLADWARRTQAHAGMRMTFGTGTADPWNALTEITKEKSPTASMLFRVVGALLNGQTGRRGYTVELANQPIQREIDQKYREARERLDRKIDEIDFLTSIYDPEFPAVYAALHQEFRQQLLARGAVPADAPDREERLEQLDQAIQQGAGAWLERKAVEALKEHRKNQLLSERQGPYHFVVNNVVNEGEMIEAESLQISPLPSEAPTQGPSALVSQRASPLPRARRIPQEGGVPQAPPVIPLQPQDLRAGLAIRLDGEEATFLRWGDNGELVVRASRNLQLLGWMPAPAEGEFGYRVDPITITTMAAGVDDGAGTGLRFAGRPPG